MTSSGPRLDPVSTPVLLDTYLLVIWDFKNGGRVWSYMVMTSRGQEAETSHDQYRTDEASRPRRVRYPEYPPGYTSPVPTVRLPGTDPARTAVLMRPSRQGRAVLALLTSAYGLGQSV